jgi:hypothetical protein
LIPGDAVVDIGEVPAEELWSYTRSTDVARGKVRISTEGVYRPGAVDERTIQWRGVDDAPFRSRVVVLGSESWHDSTYNAGWVHCDSSETGAAHAEKELDFCWDPRDTNPGSGGPERCPVFIGAGSKVVVRNPQPGVIDGEPVTTYEVIDFAPEHTDYAYLRVRMTLDAQNRLRGGTVFDRDTGQVYLTLTAGPAPDHPPIADPSAEPLFTTEPPPPPPDLGTVPPAG